jgi:large subunit ribosomal protein L4
MAVPTYTKSGSKSSSQTTLDASVFGTKVTNHDLLKQAYTAYQANGRENLAKTLRRGEVRGGGKKPWKQKGTGRARFGSIRVPIWRGGGITFGPLGEENYSKKLPTGMKRLAIRQALSLKATAKAISVVESFEVKDGKTASAAKLLKKLSASRNILIAVSSKDKQTERAVRNLENVKLVQATYLNVYDIMNADTIIIEKAALETISSWLSNKKEAK